MIFINDKYILTCVCIVFKTSIIIHDSTSLLFNDTLLREYNCLTNQDI